MNDAQHPQATRTGYTINAESGGHMPQVQHDTLPTLPHPETSTSALVLDNDSLDRMMRLADIMATGRTTIPKHLADSPADCLAVVMQAMQWKMNPFAVAQKTHLVNGTLGYEAQLVNAVIQASGSITGRFHYDYRGEGGDLECRVGAVIRGEKEITWGEWLKASDVTTKNSPLWKTNPRQQMGYLQVKNWARAYCPGAILGVYTPDELEQRPAERDVTPPKAAFYPEEDFSTNLPKWKKVIESGRKSAEDIIRMVESKAPLTDEQKQTLRDAEVTEVAE